MCDLQIGKSGKNVLKRFISKILIFLCGVYCVVSFLFVPVLSASIIKVDANSAIGFHWPYYLYTPAKVSSEHILVVPNNSPLVNDSFAYHQDLALEQLNMWKTWADSLGTPLLVPIFPRFNDEYDGTIAPQGLGRGTLETSIPSYARIDLQLIAMVEDIRHHFSTQGISLDGRMYFWGTSQAGWFISRFVLLHPERVRAAAYGFVGWPAIPSISHKGLEMPYPYGLGGVSSLTRTKFDKSIFCQVPQFITCGELDNNTFGLPWYMGGDKEEFGTMFRTHFGTTTVSMHNSAKDIFYELGSIAFFKIYPGIGHTMTVAMSEEALSFLKSAPHLSIKPDLDTYDNEISINLMPVFSIILDD